MALPVPPAIAPNAGQGIRTYGRVTDQASGARYWVQVSPDADGWSDTVYLTSLIQCFKLNWGESPFFGDWGIPAHQSVLQQIAPDYYVTLIQQRYAPFFASLQIAKVINAVEPTYTVNVLFHNGARISTTVIPQALVDGYGLAVVDGHGYPVSTGGTKSGTYVAV